MRKNHWTSWITLGVVLGTLNLLVHFFFFRIDLTSDKRYSMHPATKTLLKELKAPLDIKIYLAGDLPIELKRLQYAIRHTLKSFQYHTPQPLRYTFIDPDTYDPIEKEKMMHKWLKSGIQPTHFFAEEQGKRVEKWVIPGATMHYKQQEESIMLLKGHNYASKAALINQSIENIEYALVSALQKLTTSSLKKIAFIASPTHFRPKRFSSVLHALDEQYDLHVTQLTPAILQKNYEALIFISPTQPVEEIDKYVLDQYIMQGGKVLFFLDTTEVDKQSLQKGQSVAMYKATQLDDLLFQYGVRINPDLIQDLQCGVFPVVTGKLGDKPDIQLLPWRFYPIISTLANHPITKNLDALYPHFVSSIDTVKASNITKTPLLFTSTYTQKTSLPTMIDLESLRIEPDPYAYQQGHLPICYLLEGTFRSLYTHQPIAKLIGIEKCLTVSKPTKLLVATSSHYLMNEVNANKKLLKWGYDPFLQRTFAHKDFVLDALSYMLDEKGVVDVKNKNFTIRLLDGVRVKQQKLSWQLFNFITPIALLLLIGLIWNALYIRRYGKQKKN